MGTPGPLGLDFRDIWVTAGTLAFDAAPCPEEGRTSALVRPGGEQRNHLVDTLDRVDARRLVESDPGESAWSLRSCRAGFRLEEETAESGAGLISRFVGMSEEQRSVAQRRDRCRSAPPSIPSRACLAGGRAERPRRMEGAQSRIDHQAQLDAHAVRVAERQCVECAEVVGAAVACAARTCSRPCGGLCPATATHLTPRAGARCVAAVPARPACRA